MNTHEILARGYLPRELPPPFTSQSFATVVQAYGQNLPATFACNPGIQGNFHSLPAIHNLARAGTLRRKLSIPNPINYFQLADLICGNWQTLLQHVTASSFSLTTPQATPGKQRAIEPVKDFGYLPIARSLCRASARYVLQTDIGNYYPSIYTHVIPWALHTKLVAKQNQHNFGYLGNVIDLIIRNSQDRQTLGIHIGPDCSLLVSEIILSTVDVKLVHAGITNGFRYLDDYEFCFISYSDAEQALANLQGELSEYELALNPRKTLILELPVPLEHPWASQLRNFRIRNSSSGQQFDLIGYFTQAYELSKHYPDEHVLSFALGRMRRSAVVTSNWPLYESILLHIGSVEPGALPIVVDELFRYMQAGYQVGVPGVGDVLHEIIRRHVRVNHGSEVGRAIWGCLLFKISLDDKTADLVASMEDSVVALLALDAKSKGLISNNVNFAQWASMMTTQSLREENWLLSYEANVKGWLPSLGGHDHVAADPNFCFLKQNGVSFYDDKLSIRYQPSGVAIAAGPSGEEQPDIEQAEEASG